MSEQTTKLIEALAAKLGTTAEHLWGVLIRQAPISATIDMVSVALFAVLLVCAWRLRARCIRDEKDKNYGAWADDSPASIVSATVLGITSVALPLVLMVTISDSLAGFFNPEYWALKQVLSIGK